jgi:hypothetical protein
MRILPMSRVTFCSLVACLALITACGGGGATATPEPPVNSTNVVASFTPDQAAPGPSTVSMKQGTKSGDHVTVEVQVTDTGDVYGVAFDLVYDASNTTYTNWSAGSLLEAGGHNPTYQVGTAQPGRLVVAATRNAVAGTDASGSKTIMKLTFRVEEAGAFPTTIQNGALYNDQSLQPVPGINWFAGTLTGN